LEPDLAFRQIDIYGWVFLVAYEWVGLRRRRG